MAFTPERLLRALDECVDGADAAARPGLCVALSGGLDSTVLLAALARLRDGGRLAAPVRAMHVDHGLHPDSSNWAAACRALAATLAVDLQEIRVDATAAPGESPEAVARGVRYAALKARMAPGEILLTAHHADDQLETILLQWLRGGGLSAIAGMGRRARFGPGWHVRPMLGFSRDDLREWAEESGLAWQEDPSNLDRRFDRNYLRLEVLPALRRRWPAAARTAGRVAEYAADALELEEVLAQQDLAGVAVGAALSLERLHALGDARQRSVLRAWLRRIGVPPPSAMTLRALRRDMAVAAEDRIPQVDWPGAVVRRYRGHLYGEAPAGCGLPTGPWDTAASREFDLGNGAGLELVADLGRGLSQARLPASVDVVARAAGESFQPAGGAHRRPLRKWFQDQGVLPWLRGSVPMLGSEGRIVAVADICCAAEFAAVADEPSWRVRWHGRPLLTEAETFAFNWPEYPSLL